MKNIASLDSIIGGLFYVTFDFEAEEIAIDFTITAQTSNTDIEFASDLHSRLTGLNNKESKNIFLEHHKKAIQQNTPATVSIYYS